MESFRAVCEEGKFEVQHNLMLVCQQVYRTEKETFHNLADCSSEMQTASFKTRSASDRDKSSYHDCGLGAVARQTK